MTFVVTDADSTNPVPCYIVYDHGSGYKYFDYNISSKSFIKL